MTDTELLARYAETAAQLRAGGWSEQKILAALRRRAERENGGDG